MDRTYTAIMIGAGPAGLTAAYMFAKQGAPVIVLESDPQYVGGLSRTVEYHGFRFDIGGHRFFSKSQEIEDLWDEILGDEFLERPRLSRIYYNNKFLSYPIQPFELLRKLGVVDSGRAVLSYFKARLAPVQNPVSFEDWVTNQFGAYLYRAFFKTYTEKVWGMSCQDISADWAAQRIAGLSLSSALKAALFPRATAGRSDAIKTLVASFRYPRLGPGMMWETCRDKIVEYGGTVLNGRRVTKCVFDGDLWEVTATGEHGVERFRAKNVINSGPLREFAGMIEPAFSADALASAASLKYRDFITVAVMATERFKLPDTWVYVHDPSVKVGRIQNFKAWSPDLVPDPGMCCYGLEYFCFEGDGLWTSSDAELADLAVRELAKLGIVEPSDVKDACVVRQLKAYPVYDDFYLRHVEVIRRQLEQYPGAHLIGRNGMHKYNNQDHAMMTAMLTVKNILKEGHFDVWGVNQDAEYHESGRGTPNAASGVRSVPRKLPTDRNR